MDVFVLRNLLHKLKQMPTSVDFLSVEIRPPRQ
jgi:hypothetical protein